MHAQNHFCYSAEQSLTLSLLINSRDSMQTKFSTEVGPGGLDHTVQSLQCYAIGLVLILNFLWNLNNIPSHK